MHGEPEFRFIQLDQIDLMLPTLMRLVNEGYGFHGDDDYARMQVELEYRGEDKKALFAYLGGIEVGSLVITNAVPEAKAPLFLELLDPQLQKKILDSERPLLSVGGIVVLPELQGVKLSGGRSVAKGMIETFARDLDPIAVFGSTKNPMALLARYKTLTSLGYLSWYGHQPLQLLPEELKHSDSIAKQLMSAYWQSRQEPISTDVDGVYFKSTDILPPNVPEIDDLPPEIQQAFQPIVTAQMERGSSETAVTTLLSIHQDLFKS